jgi:hypothetical protein
MEVKLAHLDRLVEMLAEKTGQPLDLRGFDEMSTMIGVEKISKKYLYEAIHLSKEKARRKNLKTLNLQITKLDLISKFLEYPSFRAFADELEKPIDKTLSSCVGSYFNYVRRNGKDTVVLRSPVKIYMEKNKFLWQLKGPSSRYVGELHYRDGCLFVLMVADNGKMIHHVYRVGKALRPDVIKGIFSGVSTTFDPIGGRTVLVRVKEEFDGLKNGALSVSQLKSSKLEHERKLLKYFKDSEANNVSVNSVGITFTLDDL